MNLMVVATLGGIFMITLADVRVQRLKAAGHIGPNANGLEVAWLAFLAPVLHVLWAGLYEMIRTVARGTRQKPPFEAFLKAWVTGRAQTVKKVITVTERSGEKRCLEVHEIVKPPRPPGRPRKHPEGWRKARLTGRPRGRPRKVQSSAPSTEEARHDK